MIAVNINLINFKFNNNFLTQFAIVLIIKYALINFDIFIEIF